MGRYMRKTDRQSWSEHSMRMAIGEVKSGRMGAKKAAMEFGVPRTTLRRRLTSGNKSLQGEEKGLGSLKVSFMLLG